METDYLAGCLSLIVRCPWGVLGGSFSCGHDCDDDDDTKIRQMNPAFAVEDPLCRILLLFLFVVCCSSVAPTMLSPLSLSSGGGGGMAGRAAVMCRLCFPVEEWHASSHGRQRAGSTWRFCFVQWSSRRRHLSWDGMDRVGTAFSAPSIIPCAAAGRQQRSREIQKCN